MHRSPEPVLYSFRRCPFAMRARLALVVGRTRYELREVMLGAKPAELLEASPKGTVPVLVVPCGRVVDESLQIMDWALKLSDPEAWLDRVDVDLIAENDGRFKRDLDGYKYAARATVSSVAHRESGLEFLHKLDVRMSSGEGLAGASRGLTDAAIVPFVRQFASVDPDWFEAQSLPNLQPWLDQYCKSDLFQSVMLRVPPWSPGEAPVIITPVAEQRST